MQLGNLKAKGDGEFVSVPESARETLEKLPEKEPLKAKAKTREYPDFDYKYDKDADTRNSEPEAVEYSDQGAGAEHNVKQAVHNYIQSHKEKIKAVNADIKDALLISSNLEDELPKQDLQRDSVRLKQKPSPSRPQRNRLNGVDIHLDTSGTGVVVELQTIHRFSQS